MSKEIPSAVRALADDLKSKLTIDEATGVATIDGAEDIFARHLPASLTLDQVKDTQDHLLNFTAAQTLAQGEASLDVMAKNSDLKVTTLKSNVGYSQVDSSFHREKSGTAMDKDWRKRGVASADFTLGTGRRKGGFKAVVDHLGEKADSVFAN